MPTLTSSSPTDLETLVAAIKREALLRGDPKPFHERTDQVLRMQRDTATQVENVGATLPASVQSLQQWMPYHGNAFLISAYRTLLQREPDTVGLANFTLKIAEGRLARWEVLGRLRLSGEGRVRNVRVKGLWLGFFLATAYRVPIAGPLLALLARLICIPPYLRDHAGDDRLIAQWLASGR